MTDPLLPDPIGMAQRMALGIMELDPERRQEAVMKIGEVLAGLAQLNGCSLVDSAMLALDMQRRIEEAVRAIAVSGGGAGGRG